MNFKQAIKIIATDGWILVRQKGSHKQFKHPIKKGVVTIACHKESDEVKIGTLNSILKQAQIKNNALIPGAKLFSFGDLEERHEEIPSRVVRISSSTERIGARVVERRPPTGCHCPAADDPAGARRPDANRDGRAVANLRRRQAVDCAPIGPRRPVGQTSRADHKDSRRFVDQSAALTTP